MYKIAIGSSNGIDVDLKFGEAEAFLIYQVNGTEYELIEKRHMQTAQSDAADVFQSACGHRNESSGCAGGGCGCSGASAFGDKAEVISDCRCVVCEKIGFQAQKQFERRAVSVFDVACRVDEALEKIIFYYNKIDSKKSLRKEV